MHQALSSNQVPLKVFPFQRKYVYWISPVFRRAENSQGRAIRRWKCERCGRLGRDDRRTHSKGNFAVLVLPNSITRILNKYQSKISQIQKQDSRKLARKKHPMKKVNDSELGIIDREWRAWGNCFTDRCCANFSTGVVKIRFDDIFFTHRLLEKSL